MLARRICLQLGGVYCGVLFMFRGLSGELSLIMLVFLHLKRSYEANATRAMTNSSSYLVMGSGALVG